MMNGERRDLDVVRKGLQTTDAFQFDWLSQISGYPEGPFRDSEIEGIPERSGAGDAFRRELRNRTLLFAFEMKAVCLDLAQVDFHGMKNDE
jgi:hypothetical protein